MTRCGGARSPRQGHVAIVCRGRSGPITPERHRWPQDRDDLHLSFSDCLNANFLRSSCRENSTFAAPEMRGDYRCAVGICGVLGGLFCQKDAVVIAVGCAGRREHEFGATSVDHCFDQVERAQDVIAPVEAWVLRGLADLAQRCKMHDG